MKVYPKSCIFPAILAASAALTIISIHVNTGYASSKTFSNESTEEVTENLILTLSPKFPQEIQQWKLLIEENANISGLDPNLIGALILQESGGQPEVISSSGAVGLMQVMPRDGIAAKFMCINGPCFTHRPTITELSDVDFNLQYGIQMLSGLLDKTGNMREALKSYGPADFGYAYADLVLTLKTRFE